MAKLGITQKELQKLCDKHFTNEAPPMDYLSYLLFEKGLKFHADIRNFFYLGHANNRMTLTLIGWYRKTEQKLTQFYVTKESVTAFVNDFNELVDRKKAQKVKRGKVTKLKSEAVVAQAKRIFGDNLKSYNMNSTYIKLYIYSPNIRRYIFIWVPLSLFKEVLPHLKDVVEIINGYGSPSKIPVGQQFIFGDIKAVIENWNRVCKFMKCKAGEIDCAPIKKAVKYHSRQNTIRRLKMIEKTNLYGSWSAAKVQAESSAGVDKIVEHLESQGIKGISAVNVVLVLQQARAFGYKGMPYIHFKTFDGWLAVGKRVKRGEECKIHTITWCAGKPKGNEDAAPSDAPKQASGKLWPKRTCLFHESQCE